MTSLNAGLGPPISYLTYYDNDKGQEVCKWTWTYKIKVKEEALRSTKHIFIHIPKTGGTSINHRYKYAINPEFSTLGHCFASTYPEWCREKMYTIVRNPYSRLVSAYKFMKRGGFRDNIEYKSLIKKFPTFEKWILNGNLRPKRTYDRTDIVTELLIPQFCFIYELSGTHKLMIPESHILRFENYAADIEKHFGIPKTNQIHSNVTQSDKNEWKRYYTNKEVQNKVYTLYFRDFKIFGYPYEI